jgi:hypothetical protein
VQIYLSRWESADKARDEFTKRFGDPQDWSLDSDETVGKKWDYEGKDEDSDTPLLAHIRLYDDSPYSIFVQVTDPHGAGADADESWSVDQLFRSPSAIAAQGTG